MKKYIFLFASISFFSANAQTARKYSNEFLNIGVDARSFAMGNAVVANIDNANATYWNPAGLTEVHWGVDATAMHAEYFQSIAKFDYAAVAIPFNENNTTLGISLMRFGVDDILNTTELIDNQGNINYEKITKFSSADYALTMSYAGYFLGNKDIQIGANAKLVYRHIGKFAKGIGFGLDLGAQYRMDNGWFVGAMARDITTTFNAWKINYDEVKKIQIDDPSTDESVILNDIPAEGTELTLPKLQMGIGKKHQFNDRWSLLAEVDLGVEFQKTNAVLTAGSVSFKPMVGAELSYDDMVFVRGGLNNMQNIQQFDGSKKTSIQPNVGVGFKYKGIYVDYALTNFGDQGLGLYSNIFSLRLDFGQINK